MRVPVLVLVTLSGTAFSAVAQLPHEGTWAIDYASSDPGEVVWDFEALAPGLWQFRSDGRAILQFRMDDQGCTSCLASEPWKVIGQNAWDTGWLSLSGLSDIVRIAPDDESLSITSRKAGRNGETIDRVRTFQRLSGGPGLAGAWRMATERSTSPPLIEFDSDPYDVVVFKSPTEGLICVVILNGNDSPCFAAYTAGWTRAMTLSEIGDLEVLVKKDGKPVAESTYTVSPNGRSMLQSTVSASGGSLMTVYRRQ